MGCSACRGTKKIGTSSGSSKKLYSYKIPQNRGVSSMGSIMNINKRSGVTQYKPKSSSNKVNMRKLLF